MKLEELKKEYEELKQRVEELGEMLDRKEKSRFKPNDGQIYWSIGNCGEVCEKTWGSYSFEEDRYRIGNVFETKKQAELEVEKLKVMAELKEFGRPFKGGAYNWCIVFDHKTKEIVPQYGYFWENINDIFFDSREDTKQAIKQVGEERIKKYLFGVTE